MLRVLQSCVGIALAGSFAHAQLISRQVPPSDAVERGQKQFVVQCGSCHGANARGDDNGPDLVRSEIVLDDEQGNLIGPVVRKGRPNEGMPAFDRLAYSDGRCYGMKQADLQKLGSLPDPAATLQAREIDQVADFLFAKVVGQGPMDRAKCIEYWGSDVEACHEFPK